MMGNPVLVTGAAGRTFLVDHLATMADLHRAGRYDRLSTDVLTLTGQGPMSVREIVTKNAATFTAAAKAAGPGEG